MGPLGSGPRCGTDGLGQYKTPDMPDSVRDGLWRPGGAFFQIGLGCVMSHHHTEGLCTFLFKFLAGNLIMEVGLTKPFPVAQIRPNSHKIVSSSTRAYPVAQICAKSHKMVSSSIRAFPVAQIRPDSHKIVSNCLIAFLVA